MTHSEDLDDDDFDSGCRVPWFDLQWSRDLQPASDDIPWLWDGYLAPYHVTLLTSQWKCGKTTLLSVLLARRAAGGTLAGRALRPGRTAVVSEEPPDIWRQRRRHLDFGDGSAFYYQPFHYHKPNEEQWDQLLQSVAHLRKDGIDLLVIDPLASFLPTYSESASDLMLRALSKLDRVIRIGMAVLLLHHPRKGPTLEGQAARGPGVLSHFVDILVEMRPFRSPAEDDRRRVLQSWSRLPATPRQLVIEWAADGADYRPLGTVADAEYHEHWDQLAAFFVTAPDKLTRRELRALWPAGSGTPSEHTLWRWLERAVATQLLRREGTGHKNAPFRYWLPSREAEWLADPRRRMQAEQAARRAELDALLSRPPEPIPPRPKQTRKRSGSAPAAAGAEGSTGGRSPMPEECSPRGQDFP